MLIVCERHQGEGTREEEKSISDTDRHRSIAVGGKEEMKRTRRILVYSLRYASRDILHRACPGLG